MRVSIGIPTFNRARSLPRALESACTQTFADVECIVSDNGSTDETPQICAAFRARYPKLRVLRQPVNVGPTRNFRAVLEAATGDYFMWLADDDWLDPGFVAACMAQFAAQPRAAIVTGTTSFHDPAGAQVGEHRPAEFRQASALARVCRYFATVRDNSSFYGLARRADFMAVGLEKAIGWDWLLVAALAARGPIVLAPDARMRRTAARFGAASSDYHRMVDTLGLPRWQARVPGAVIVGNVLRFYVTQGARTGLSAWRRALLVPLLPGLFLLKALANPRNWKRAVGLRVS